MNYTYSIYYIIKRKQVYIVLSLCKETDLHNKILLQICITFDLYMFVTNTTVKRLYSKNVIFNNSFNCFNCSFTLIIRQVILFCW